MLRWCEAHGVRYIVGIAKNPRLHQQAEALLEDAEREYQATGKKQRWFGSVNYGAHTWDRKRRVIVKAEHTALGSNPRFVVTNLPQTDRYPTVTVGLYNRIYCARGDMENRLKDQQLDLFADRTSCHGFWPNQFRQLLSALAYTLIEGLRRLAPIRTVLATASPNRIRLTLLRVGAVVGCGGAQYPPHPTVAEQCLPAPGVVPYGRRSSGHFLTIAECCPGTLTNNGGKEEVYPQFTKSCLNNRLWAIYRRWKPDYRSRSEKWPHLTPLMQYSG